MAYFARLNENNVVVEVLSVNNDVIKDDNGVEQEALGVQFLNNLFSQNYNWKQTSYNHNFRNVYAGIDYRYIPEKDAFIPPQPFPSWTFNEETLQWNSPVAIPFDAENPNITYAWNEEDGVWEQMTE